MGAPSTVYLVEGLREGQWRPLVYKEDTTQVAEENFATCFFSPDAAYSFSDFCKHQKEDIGVDEVRVVPRGTN